MKNRGNSQAGSAAADGSQFVRASRHTHVGAEAVDAALRAFQDFLTRQGMRTTRVRLAVAAAALKSSGHFRAEDLVHTLRRHEHRISATSVYRTMPILVAAGLLQGGQQKRVGRYEATVGREPHHHLACLGCGKVREFRGDELTRLMNEIGIAYDFQVSSVEASGLCASCLSASQRTSPRPD